jgi:predicted Rossmann fold nucleotide-binding protein DprA/Smf involved in DNA uptake
MDLQRAVALSALPGTSRSRAAAIFKALTDQSGGSPVSLEDVIAVCRPDADAAALIDAALAIAASLLESGRARGITPVPIWADAYPPLLRMITDPPPVLWVRGDASTLASRAVAVIGSRAATPYALEVARRLAGNSQSAGQRSSQAWRAVPMQPLIAARSRARVPRWRSSAADPT